MTETAPAHPDVAMRGVEGHDAERLLDKCIKAGNAVLRDVMREALTRILKRRAIASRLWTAEEKQEVLDQMMATIAAADLLGRVSIRDKEQR